MYNIFFRPFWSYDILRTEAWLTEMHQKGFVLCKINSYLRLFYFKRHVSAPSPSYYRIVFDKHLNGTVPTSLTNSSFEKVCSSGNYYIIRSLSPNPQNSPSYINFMDRNRKLKFVFGMILLIIICLYAMPSLFVGVFLLLIIFSALTGNLIVEEAPSTNLPTPSEAEVSTIVSLFATLLFSFIIVCSILLLWWLIYSYFKLRKTNKQLEKLCGDTLNLSFTTPTEILLEKEVENKLFRENKIIRKLRIAWIYAPDKVEIWLEKMASNGFILYKMSKLGNSFYFIKDEPKKIKFCIDYQSKAYPQYFNLNKECGWQLIFTSLSRLQSLNVWAQEYTHSPPLFYSDAETRLKQAKTFALTYSLLFFPACILYAFFIAFSFCFDYGSSFMPLSNIIIYLLLIFECGFFAARTILYYFRVKKSCKIEL